VAVITLRLLQLKAHLNPFHLPGCSDSQTAITELCWYGMQLLNCVLDS